MSGRQRMWNVLRVGTPLTVRALAEAAGAGAENARYYTRWLCRAGHLVVRKAKGGRNVYIFLRGGLTAPQIMKAEGIRVYDPEKETIWRPVNEKN